MSINVYISEEDGVTVVRTPDDWIVAIHPNADGCLVLDVHKVNDSDHCVEFNVCKTNDDHYAYIADRLPVNAASLCTAYRCKCGWRFGSQEKNPSCPVCNSPVYYYDIEGATDTEPPGC